ncbi:hypothetical protein GCM10010112_90910 [Actinoplanes lobatus]|uniref:Uncharacterized protein n=1 Tax=Actinoplanes lobatus TaxID=113568 RepID=A0ABQ4AYI5_9ACTN|nr:hypothetical protein GCM10010112_90910 [Actinoplanes lobatus]GIE45875.1 hypothetical protein Alo02nite_87730 [Actinoplanes lobatus]
MSSTKAGLLALAVGLIGAAANLWAEEAFPVQWGGPNIGAGFLQLGFGACVVSGSVLTAVGLVKYWRNRSS